MFFEALNLWGMWKRFGLPHGKGWLDESHRTIQLIRTVDEERNLYDSKEMESKRGSSGRVKSHHTR